MSSAVVMRMETNGPRDLGNIDIELVKKKHVGGGAVAKTPIGGYVAINDDGSGKIYVRLSVDALLDLQWYPGDLVGFDYRDEEQGILLLKTDDATAGRKLGGKAGDSNGYFKADKLDSFPKWLRRMIAQSGREGVTGEIVTANGLKVVLLNIGEDE